MIGSGNIYEEKRHPITIQMCIFHASLVMLHEETRCQYMYVSHQNGKGFKGRFRHGRKTIYCGIHLISEIGNPSFLHLNLKMDSSKTKSFAVPIYMHVLT